MDEDTTSDQRLPHKLNPNVECSTTALSELGERAATLTPGQVAHYWVFHDTTDTAHFDCTLLLFLYNLWYVVLSVRQYCLSVHVPPTSDQSNPTL